MKIVLICAVGMSTSLIVEKMKKEAASRTLDAQIIAVPMDDFDRHIDGASVMLLGPQIRFKLTEFERKGNEKGIPVAMINSMDYGMVNGKKILDAALALVK
jgi:PTS system cellobiose-specific IIB component